MLASSGCQTAKTVEMQQRALALKPELETFTASLQAQLKKQDQDYRDTYGRLMLELQTFSSEEVTDLFDLDGQKAADELLADWKTQTLPRAFRDRFAAMMQAHLNRIMDANAALESARTNYASAYKQIKLKLANLKKVDADLTLLGQPQKFTYQDLSALLKVAEAVSQEVRTNTFSKSVK
jgi:hypothetical protein